ncbi:hypothetical protein [Synoicihabitans lomoniglobus]|uniref:Uncharacterized protein n=1 Tax=Synoicihabitans lomoniglobus TaxID=2909285 RepID=A0AAF0CQ07_9BACT|nr:hypothetical protein [Opitutaceae bacterium LMO-M01]WED65931.1 hypothetical protein PXH66_03595 [Opitutaceae bacterium LMO-M01]
MDDRLSEVLKLETLEASHRSAALAGAPIAVRSALDRKAQAPTTAPAAPKLQRENDDDDREDGIESWSNADMEAAMAAEAEARDGMNGGTEPRKPSRREREATLDGGPLPDLEAMIATVPADLQEKMDDLFRAKFQGVRRVPAATLKKASSTAST